MKVLLVLLALIGLTGCAGLAAGAKAVGDGMNRASDQMNPNTINVNVHQN